MSKTERSEKELEKINKAVVGKSEWFKSFTFRNEAKFFADHSREIGLSEKVKRAALGEINLVITHNGVTGSGKSTYCQLCCMEICNELLATAEINEKIMFAITVRTMVGYPRDDGDVTIKYLAAGEDGALKPTLGLLGGDDGRRIFSGLEAFVNHLAAVKTFTETSIYAATTSNQTSSRAFTTMEFTVDSETAVDSEMGSVAKRSVKRSVITITDEVGNESGLTVTANRGRHDKSKTGSGSVTTSILVNKRYEECERLPKRQNLSWY